MAEGGGLLNRVQPNTDTAKFSLFHASFLQRVAARDAAAVVPFVALSSRQRRISALSVASGAARHAALFSPSPSGFWPPPPGQRKTPSGVCREAVSWQT